MQDRRRGVRVQVAEPFGTSDAHLLEERAGGLRAAVFVVKEDAAVEIASDGFGKLRRVAGFRSFGAVLIERLADENFLRADFTGQVRDGLRVLFLLNVRNDLQRGGADAERVGFRDPDILFAGVYGKDNLHGSTSVAGRMRTSMFCAASGISGIHEGSRLTR